ncbi:MAG: T9SS type A sorting domain-containing protein, partial [Paludibacteraceae bacterium]|nr:T9SS type A sorting domain-containing protein [Paludibacteraceae bacterium]
KNTEITAFEDCQLYNVKIVVEDAQANEAIAAESEAVTLYPNPTTGTFNISSEQAVVKVELMNLVGQVVAVSNAASMNANVAAGSYLVRITTEDGMVTIKKLVVK